MCQTLWLPYTMRVTIDSAGRLVVPKALRDELGFTGGVELEVSAVDGHLEVALPSRARVETGPHGLRFAADSVEPLTAEEVRALMERVRR
jgi:AbrB family looped-hinge helix DNA binding protein